MSRGVRWDGKECGQLLEWFFSCWFHWCSSSINCDARTLPSYSSTWRTWVENPADAGSMLKLHVRCQSIIWHRFVSTKWAGHHRSGTFCVLPFHVGNHSILGCRCMTTEVACALSRLWQLQCSQHRCSFSKILLNILLFWLWIWEGVDSVVAIFFVVVFLCGGAFQAFKLFRHTHAALLHWELIAR